MKKLKSCSKKDQLTKLKALLAILADAIDAQPGARDLAQLSKQYRDTLAEIERLEGGDEDDDDIGAVLERRAADGLPGAVRKNRA